VKTNAEITLEANPDDLTPEYVAMLRQLPVNRISMGIQTFQEETLKLLHRRHTATQAIEAFRRCREAGFQNISIDLMYGLPGENLETWKEDLRQAINLRPEHISAYHLIYEEDTALWRLREQHCV
jgi:oxygen-independent coproporphyrinogen-3 oxidase